MEEVDRLLQQAKGKRELADLLAKGVPLVCEDQRKINAHVKRLRLEAKQLEARAARRRDSLGKR